MCSPCGFPWKKIVMNIRAAETFHDLQDLFESALLQTSQCLAHTRQTGVYREGQKVMPVGLGSQAISGSTPLVLLLLSGLQQDDNPSPRSEITSAQTC